MVNLIFYKIMSLDTFLSRELLKLRVSSLPKYVHRIICAISFLLVGKLTILRDFVIWHLFALRDGWRVENFKFQVPGRVCFWLRVPAKLERLTKFSLNETISQFNFKIQLGLQTLKNRLMDGAQSLCQIPRKAVLSNRILMGQRLWNI